MPGPNNKARRINMPHFKMGRVDMPCIKKVRLATQGIAAVLLFGVAFAAVGAEQMRALPRTAPAPAVNAVPAPAKSNAALAPALVPEIIIDGGGITIGGKLVPFNGASPVSVSWSSCNIPFQFPLKNIGGKELWNFTISMKMKSEQSQGLVYDGPLGGLSLAPGASYLETHNGSGLNLVSGAAYSFTVDTDYEHSKRKDISRGHIYSVRFTPICGSAPLPPPGTPGTTPTPTQQSPKQSMGGGLKMGSALTPASRPPGSPTKPMSQTGSAAAPMSQKKLAPPTPGGGVMQLSPAAACGMNSTPRISSINGRASAGIVFKPGDSLNISGCGFGGFGKGAQAALYNVGGLIIDGWDDSNIHAHIDPALKGVPDSVGSVKLFVTPYGVPALVSAGHSFTAAREEVQVALPKDDRGIYSQFFGAHTKSNSGNTTTVERNLSVEGPPYCPNPTDQEQQMKDVWPIDSEFLKAFKEGFIVVRANYVNLTDQRGKFDGIEYNDRYDAGVVGNAGGAAYDGARVTVIYQGHSTYGKKHVGFQADNFDGPQPGFSACTSRYRVSLTLSGPRGVSPLNK